MKRISKPQQNAQMRTLLAEGFITMINSKIYHRNCIPFGYPSDNIENFEDFSTRSANLPKYLRELIASPFSNRPEQLIKDIMYLISTSEHSGEIFVNEFSSLNSKFLTRQMNVLSVHGNSVAPFSSLNKGFVFNGTGSCINQFRAMKAANNMAELRKGQELVGSPVLHVPVTLNGHPEYNEIPETFFSNDWKWVKALGSQIRDQLSIKRADTFTLPLTTSQGLLLKGKGELMEDRVRSKALLSAIAMKSDSKEMLDVALDSVGEAFTMNGFENPGGAFYVGMRKQQARKPEAIQNREGLVINSSNAFQGRVRGIFPSSEAIKVFLKPVSDGVKKGLFERSEGMGVDPFFIARDSLVASALTLKLGLVHDTNENMMPDGIAGSFESLDFSVPLTFYDLSAYDTTQHAGLNDLVYMEAMRGIFPDLDDVEGSMCSIARLYFPTSPLSDEIKAQDVNGWSTMSGQPDVTIKNNLIHLLVMVNSLYGAIELGRAEESSMFYNCDEISRDRILRAILHQNDFISSKIHGDDTFLVFSSSVLDYMNYFSILESTGIRYSNEYCFSYLKKIPREADLERLLSEVDKSEGRPISLTEWISLLNRLRKKASEIVRKENLNDYFSGLDNAMIPVYGSLLKNRFGEYPIEFVGSFLLGILDVFALCVSENDGAFVIHELFNELTALSILLETDDPDLIALMTQSGEIRFVADYHGILSEMIISLSNCINFEDLNRKISIPRGDVADTLLVFSETKKIIAAIFQEIMVSRMDIAESLREHLTRMYYSSYQNEEIAFGEDEFLSSIYGLLSYDPHREAMNYGFANKSLEELVAYGCELQSALIKNNGYWNV